MLRANGPRRNFHALAASAKQTRELEGTASTACPARAVAQPAASTPPREVLVVSYRTRLPSGLASSLRDGQPSFTPAHDRRILDGAALARNA
jgi:hypothetical protein